jgi:predicted transposase YdaD
VAAPGLTDDELNRKEDDAVHKPYDATLKELVERHPVPWLSLLLGRAVDDVQVFNADLSTITAEADKLLRVRGPRPWIINTEFEASYKSGAPLKGLRYSILARCRHGLPIQTIFGLLRPEADGDAFTGTLEEELPDGTKYLLFRYNVVRVRELPAAQLLAGDLATLPLAPISRVSDEELPAVIRRIDERIEHEASPGEAADLWMATSMLLGLVHSGEILKTLLQGVNRMKESATYQMILEEGRQEGMIRGTRQALVWLGLKRFGPASPEIEAKLDAITDLDQLHELTDRLLGVSSWDELLEEN